MEHIYSGILFHLKKEVLTRATAWMNFKDTMLREISQSPKDKYRVIPLLCRIYTVEFIEIESRRVIARGWGKGELGSCCLLGMAFQLCSTSVLVMGCATRIHVMLLHWALMHSEHGTLYAVSFLPRQKMHRPNFLSAAGKCNKCK